MSDDRRRIYLDNAATSFPKPNCVYDAVDRYQRQLGGAVGRGATHVGAEIQQTVDRCRNNLARLLGVAKPSHVIFTLNGTDSLNLAIHGLLREGDHVVATCWEHNSVLRPLSYLAARGFIDVSILAGASNGGIDLDELKQAMTSRTKLVCVTHASNVTGVIQPVAEVVDIARSLGACVLLDAAQTAGHFPLSMSELGVDLLATPGHKGLLGPLGTGVLAIRPGLEAELMAIRQGGTGTKSEAESQPETLPDKYESGNHNGPGLFGLEAATRWLLEQTVAEIYSRQQRLTQQFRSGLARLSKFEAYGTEELGQSVSLVSISSSSIEPQILATLLDEHFGIETRAGLHCSPRAHQAIGTFDRGGTVRFSFGPFTTNEEVDLTLEALAQISASF